MTQKGLIVFVTFELYPFNNGGIGRFCYNVLESMTSEERARTLIILTNGSINKGLLAKLFPDVRLMEMENFDFATGEQSLSWALWNQDPWLAQSVKLLTMIKSIARNEKIDYIEFTDYSGAGFATIQEKRFTDFLDNTTIAVRLHSTEAILVLHESRLLSQQDLLRFDLERICLQNCDMVVGHLQSVAEFTRNVFGIDKKHWQKRLFIAEPPISLNGQQPATRSIVPMSAQRIVFSSKMQEFKRPEIFVRGVAQFLASENSFSGQVAFAFSVQQNAYVEAVLSAVPEDQRHRYVLPKDISSAKRDELISNSIVVFPTAFESYCYAAYEAAALGSVVVLNHQNPAFDQSTNWKDGVNCITFDGTVADLAVALKRCFDLHKPLDVVSTITKTQSWQLPRPAIKISARKADKSPKLTVLIVNQSEGIALRPTLQSLAASASCIAEVVVIDDGSNDPESEMILAGLAEFSAFPLRVVKLPVVHGYAGAVKVGLAQVRTDLVSVFRSGTTVKPGYLEKSVSCLNRNRDVGIVCGQVRVYNDSYDLSASVGSMSTIIGDAALTGNYRNSYGEFGFVVRTALARQFGFRSETGYLCDWAFIRNAVRKGVGIVVSPEECIGRRAMHERDFGTPIDEFERLKHILITHIDTPVLDAPVMRLAGLVSQVRTEYVSSQFPDWFNHARHEGYESEVEFMADFFGHSRFGRLIRRNTRLSSFLERLVNRVANLGPRN